MLGFEFDNNSEPYSVYNGVQSISCFLFQLINSVVATQTSYIIYTAVCGVLAMACCGTTYFFEFRDRLSVRHSNHSHDSKKEIQDIKYLLNETPTPDTET
jgi:O-antigen/teichoic acid export membrane protein